MKNINIKVNKETRKIVLSKSVIGNDGENLQGKLIFSFDDEFVNGTARLELNRNNTQSYIMLTKVNNTYELPIKSLITKVGKLDLQLVITEGTNENEIPIFKSNVFFVIVNPSINAEIEESEEYPQWIDVANTKLNEIDEALDDLQDKVDSGYFKGEKGDPGQNGNNGKDATINGINTLNIIAGENIALNQSGNNLEISATGGSGGTSDYNDLEGKPKINNVELSGNKTTSDLGIVIPDVSNLQEKITNINKLDASLVDDSLSTNKFVTSAEKTTWNEKANISDIPTKTSDLINDSEFAPQEVYNVKKTSNNEPFVFDGKKRGLYIVYEQTNAQQDPTKTKFYYKLSNNTNIKQLSARILYFYLYEDINYDNFNFNKSYGKIIYLLRDSTNLCKAEMYFNETFKELDLSKEFVNFVNYVDTIYPQNINGLKTFNTTPKVSSYTVPTTDTQLVAKKYVDDSIANAITTTLNGSY